MYELKENLQLQKLIRQRRLKDIRLYGTQVLSYSSLQDDIKEFRHPGFRGYIAYMTVWGVDYVLSNPIVPVTDYLVATMLFLDVSPNAVFCQISKSYASLLNNLGFTVNALGVDHTLDLKKFEVTWKKRRGLKRYHSKLSNQNYFVFENIVANEAIQNISAEWLQKKSNPRELRFMSRPFTTDIWDDMRIFYLIKNKTVIGFCGFDPIYIPNSSGQPVGYALQFLRTSAQAPSSGGGDYLLTSSLELLKADGIRYVSLGLAPLYERKNEDFRYSKMTEFIFKHLYQSQMFYSFQSLGRHKDRYRTEKIQTFIATPKKFSIKRLLGLLKINNLV